LCNAGVVNIVMKYVMLADKQFLIKAADALATYNQP
jgi:hypothetical protein